MYNLLLVHDPSYLANYLGGQVRGDQRGYCERFSRPKPRVNFCQIDEENMLNRQKENLSAFIPGHESREHRFRAVLQLLLAVDEFHVTHGYSTAFLLSPFIKLITVKTPRIIIG